MTHPLLRMGTVDPGVYECGEACEGDAHFHDPELAAYPDPEPPSHDPRLSETGGSETK